MANIAYKTLKRRFSPLVGALLPPRGTAAIPQADCRTHATPQGATIDRFKHASCVRALKGANSVVVHRRTCNDIRSSCSTDTFDKPVRSLSEVGTIAPASPMIPLATALPSPGLPSLTLTSSALHDGAHSHSLTAVSARGVAGGYRVMQRDRSLPAAACLFMVRALGRARALDLCGTRGVSSGWWPHSGT